MKSNSINEAMLNTPAPAYPHQCLGMSELRQGNKRARQTNARHTSVVPSLLFSIEGFWFVTCFFSAVCVYAPHARTEITESYARCEGCGGLLEIRSREREGILFGELLK